jgi:hypothetical protein
MLQRTPKQLNAVAIHEAAFRVIATKLGVPLRPPPARLVNMCRYACDVLELGARDVYSLDATCAAEADMLDAAAIVMFAGLAAIEHAHLDRSNNRDFCEAMDMAYVAQARRVGGYEMLATFSDRYHREATAVQEREFSARAKELVEKHWAEIEAEAARLLAEPCQPRRKRA